MAESLWGNEGWLSDESPEVEPVEVLEETPWLTWFEWILTSDESFDIDSMEAIVEYEHHIATHPFQFLKLPKEIRDIIYKIVLVSPNHINPESHNTSWSDNTQYPDVYYVHRVVVPDRLYDVNIPACNYPAYGQHYSHERTIEAEVHQLFTVSKFVSQEAMCVYYKYTNFLFTTPRELIDFVEFARASALVAQYTYAYNDYCKNPITRSPLEDMIGNVTLYQIAWDPSIFKRRFEAEFIQAAAILNGMPNLWRLKLYIDHNLKKYYGTWHPTTHEPLAQCFEIQALLCIRNIRRLEIQEVLTKRQVDNEPSQAEKDEVVDVLQVLKSGREIRVVSSQSIPPCNAKTHTYDISQQNEKNDFNGCCARSKSC